MIDMKKFLVLIGLLVVVGIVLMSTCPDREAHRKAISNVVSGAINSEMDNSGIEETMAAIGTVLMVHAIDTYLTSTLVVRDRTFYNVGVISYKGEFRMVSVGVFNHVFTISEDEARQLIKDKIKLPLEDLK